MSGCYVGKASVESRDFDWLELLELTVRRAAHSNVEVSKELVGQVLEDEFEVAPAQAKAWLKGVDVLTEYMMASTDQGDALIEESEAVAASRRAFRAMLEARLQRRIDAADERLRGQAQCAECGSSAKSKGRLVRERTSTLGPIELTRRWSKCADHDGYAPAEAELLIPEDDFTGPLKEAAAMMATTVPEGMAVELLGSLMGIEISKHAVQNIVHERGQHVVDATDAQARELNPFEENGLYRGVARPDDAVEQACEVAYVEIDGVIPMTRELDEAKSSAVEGARGGKGLRYNLVGREVKNAVLYTAKDCAQEMPSRGSLWDKTYVSRLGNWWPFAQAVWVEIRRRRFDEASLLVVLSDGAEWIRGLAEWLPCDVLLILDLFHAKHRVWEVSRLLWGDDTPQTKRWARRQCDRIEEGQVDKVLATLERLQRKQKTHKKVEELVGYFTNNQDRMNYPEYRAKGLRVTTAAVESANYHVTGARLKQQGMRWSEAGAAEMSALRADLFNGCWHERTRQQLRAAA